MTDWIRLLIPVGFALLIVAGVDTPAGGAQEPTPAGEEVCADCHDDMVAQFQTNPHAGKTLRALPQATGGSACETCHLNAAQHAEEGDPELVSIPRDVGGHDLCLDCHDGQLHGPTSSTAAHAGAAVYCFDCHAVHASAAAWRLLRQPTDDLCVSCHPAQARSFRKPFAHRLGVGGMECTSCHDPHGGTGERSLKTDRLGDGPCVTCHAEKRGPFVFSHVEGVTGDCLSCHEAHGSTNSKRLIRSRVEQVCLECHTGFPEITLGSQPPSLHNLRSTRFRNCTTCHVAVHGSNSSPALLK
jgi:DmsE family decaheme c-type cytochrome